MIDWPARSYHSVGFAFDAPLSVWAGCLLVLAVFVGVAIWTRRDLGRSGERRALVLLRGTVAALVVFLALGPVLVGVRSDPTSRLVLLLFDDSASMGIPDAGGRTPGERLLAAYGADDNRFERLLTASHSPRAFRFGEGVDRLGAVPSLRYGQRETRLLPAVTAALSSAAGAPVSAVVLFSDGVQQPGPADLSGFAPGVPVFPIGVRPEAEATSLSLESLAVNRSPLDDSPVEVVARVRSQGLQGRRAVLEVAADGRLLGTSAIRLPATSGTATLRLEYVPRGDRFLAHRARVRLAGSPADSAAEDNTRSYVVDNRRRHWRILFFSGRPNWQQKFLRRALATEPRFQLSSLVRISGPDRKFEFLGGRTSTANPLFQGSADAGGLAPRWDEAVFLRIGVEESELVRGYPSDPRDLYPYHVVIWGEVEREFFSRDHLELTREFVSKRGGSFLMLGGPRSLGEGGYAGSVIEPMLPVVPSATTAGREADSGFHARPTIDGVLAGVFALDPDPNTDVWTRLPELYGANRIAATRAGAAVLARIDGGPPGLDGRPLFAWQRFGEGLSAVLATGETWQWQMGVDPEQDLHGRLWRQLVRFLVQGVRDPLIVSGTEDLTVDRPETLSVLVRDSLFVTRDGLMAQAQLTAPSGASRWLPVEESVRQPGVYDIPSRFEQEGMYTLAVAARQADGLPVGEVSTAFWVHPDRRELRADRYDGTFLRQLAETTGGRFFELDDLPSVPAAIPITPGREEHVDRIPVWHWPPLYGLVVVLLAAEWYLRRRRGHP